MVRTYFLRIIVIVVVLSVLVSVACISFVQFYPFQKSPLLARANYPVVTTTASGKPGDPINVMFIGSQSAIRGAFLRAGWKIPDPITPDSSTKIAVDSLANLPYPTAPVSNLYLYHRKQDMAFEKPTNTVQVRDHIRLWDTQTTLGSEDVWLGSATYDHGIEISSKTDMPTHHVAPNVDRERDLVYQALRPYMHFSTVIPFTQPNLFGVNGGGDWYCTDGEIAILSTVNWDNKIPFSQRSVTVKDWIFGVVSPVLRFLT